MTKISDLTPDSHNANRGTQRGLKALDDSLRQYGAGRSILVDKNGRIIAGNKTAERAADIGLDDVIVVETDGKKLVAVKRVDLDLETDEAARMLAYADNRVGALDLDLDPLTIAGDIEAGLDLSSLWSDQELTEILAAAGKELTPKPNPEPQLDKAAELAEKWGTKSNQIWRLGEHRLICGDCTDRAVVDAVMMGERAALLFIDPPYGVKRDKGFGGQDGFNGSGAPIARRQYKDEWDSIRPDKATFDLHIGLSDNAIIFGGNFFADILPKSTHWVVWDKLNTMPTFGDCELAWTNFDKKSVKKITFEYNGLLGKEKERYHPTQKPVGLYELILTEYTQDDAVVIDSFLGSGTTLIACENLGRVCRAIEIDPGYVAVSIQRWVDATGQEPQLLSG